MHQNGTMYRPGGLELAFHPDLHRVRRSPESPDQLSTAHIQTVYPPVGRAKDYLPLVDRGGTVDAAARDEVPSLFTAIRIQRIDCVVVDAADDQAGIDDNRLGEFC